MKKQTAIMYNPITFLWNHRSNENAVIELNQLVIIEEAYDVENEELVQSSFRYFEPNVTEISEREPVLFYYQLEKDRKIDWIEMVTPTADTKSTRIFDTETTPAIIDETVTIHAIVNHTTNVAESTTISVSKDEITTTNVGVNDDHDDHDDFPDDIPISSANLNIRSLSLVIFPCLFASFALFGIK